METNRIRQFCVVAETENLRKASEILNLSHSALSKSLKVLQDELRQTLLAPSGRNIVITDEGKAFYKKAIEFLKHEHDLLAKDETRAETVRIGTFEVFSTHLLGTFWRKYFKDANLHLHELIPGRLEQALVEGSIDYGITYEPIPSKGVEYVRMGQIEMAIFARKGAFLRHSLEEIPFVAPITPMTGSPTGTKGLDGWPDDLLPRKVAYRVDQLESGLALARQGSAAIFTPHFVARVANLSAKDEFRLKAIPLPKSMKPVHRAVYLMKRNGQLETPAMRTLAKLIRAECIG